MKKNRKARSAITSELASVGAEGGWTSSRVKGSALAGYFGSEADKEGQNPSLHRAESLFRISTCADGAVRFFARCSQNRRQYFVY